MKEISFHDYAVTVPDHWFDITRDLEGDPPSDTVAPKGGVGRLQFEFYLPAATNSPAAALQDLRTLLSIYAKRHHLGEPNDLTATVSPRPLIAASYDGGFEFIRVCFLVDEGRQVQALYLCEHEQNNVNELAEAAEIVRSLRFTAAPNKFSVLNPMRR